VPDNLLVALKKFYFYALGDAQTGIWWHPGKKIFTHNVKIITIYLRYLILFTLAFVGIFSSIYFRIMILYILFYSFWSVFKLRKDTKGLMIRLWLPTIQISSDFAVMAGFAVGLKKKDTNNKSKSKLQLS